MRCRRAKGKCAELGLPPPKVEELDGGFFRVTFFRKRDGDECIPNTNDTNDTNDDTNHDSNDTNDADSHSAQCGCPLSDKLLEMIRATESVTIEEIMRQCMVSRPTIAAWKRRQARKREREACAGNGEGKQFKKQGRVTMICNWIREALS